MRRPSLVHAAAVALSVYGVLGFIVAVAMVLVGSTVFAQLDQWSTPIERQRGSLVQTLRGASLTLDDASSASRDLRSSIDAARTSATSGADLARSSAGSFRSLEQAMRLTVFGLQPFGAVAPQFGQTADQLETMARSLDDTSRSLSANASDVTRLGSDLATLRQQTVALASALDQATFLTSVPGSLRLFQVAFYGMCALVALQSLFSLVTGGALLSRARRSTTGIRRESTVARGPGEAPNRAA